MTENKTVSHFLATLAVTVATSFVATAQVDITSENRLWLDQSCPRSLGPSLWRSCMQREMEALREVPITDLAKLPRSLQSWVNQSCPRSLGPSLYGNCVTREVAALQLPNWPNVSGLAPDDQRWVLESCPRSLGPSLWRNCAEREISALRPASKTPSTLPPPFTPRTTPPPRAVAPSLNVDGLKPLPKEAESELPAWTGVRPSIPSRPVGEELHPTAIFRAVAPTVYLVVASQTDEALARGEGILGSAVAVSENWALTNCHVVAHQRLIVLADDQSGKKLKADIAYADERNDRCILRTDQNLRPIAALKPRDNLAVGERVYTIGNPSGLTKTLGEGLISGLRRRSGILYVQTSAPISKGSSGGALVDSRGALIGITTFLLKDAQNLNFAISADEYWR